MKRVERRALSSFVMDSGEKKLNSDYYVEGYATTYNQPYELYTDEYGVAHYEMIQAGALQGAEMADVVMLYDHDSRVVARTTNGTLLLFPNDPAGLLIAADLSKSDFAKQIHGDIQAKLLTRMSWTFEVAPGGEFYDQANHTWVITRIRRVYDVAAVALPANEDTVIEARNKTQAAEAAQAKNQLERCRAKCRALLNL